jgi:putative aminopeptidase FrvX
MWNLYANQNKGIAIRSTFVRLCASVAQAHGYPIQVSMVRYIDYDTERTQFRTGDKEHHHSTLDPYLHKRREYAHEQEVRAIISLLAVMPEAPANGIYVPCNLATLVEAVYLAPGSPQWTIPLANR